MREIRVKQYYIDIFKDLNLFFGTKETTIWTINTVSTGYRLIPNSEYCLYDNKVSHLPQPSLVMTNTEHKIASIRCLKCGFKMLTQNEYETITNIVDKISGFIDIIPYTLD